jgi:hypothetical protein
MESMYDVALASMESTLNSFAAVVPQPVEVRYKDGFVVRYREQTVHQALVLKLARIISGLHAMRLLMTHGFVQEQASLQRIQDELDEDVIFVVHGAINGLTDLHDAYLAAFWQEEFDKDSALESSQKRRMIPRTKIRAYNAQAFIGANTPDPSTNNELSRTINKAYSGYVHAAAPHIMDMYGGDPPRFYVRGMVGTPRHLEHRDDLWNYVYRGILAFGFSAAAFGNGALKDSIAGFADEFAKSAGHDYFGRADG